MLSLNSTTEPPGSSFDMVQKGGGGEHRTVYGSQTLDIIQRGMLLSDFFHPEVQRVWRMLNLSLICYR